MIASKRGGVLQRPARALLLATACTGAGVATGAVAPPPAIPTALVSSPAPAVPAALAAVDSLMQRGDWVEAERVARAALADAERQDGAETRSTAAALDALLQTLAQQQKGASPEAREVAARAVDLKQRLYGPDEDETAVTLNRAAQVWAQAGELDRARDAYHRALRIRQRTRGPSSIEVARLMSNLGALESTAGDSAAARTWMEQALALKGKLLDPEDPSIGYSLANLAVVLCDLGDWDAAKNAMERAVAIGEKHSGPDHPDVAADRANLGWIQIQRGEYARAQQLLERALDVEERRLGPTSLAVAGTLTNLGIALERRGDLSRARAAYERALAVREQAQGPQHAAVAGALTNLANVVSRVGDVASARQLYLRSNAVLETAAGADRAAAANNFQGMGVDLLAGGDVAGARAALLQARMLREGALGPDHLSLIVTLDALGRCALADGDVAQARELFQRGLEIARRPGNDSAVDHVSGVLRGLAAVTVAQGHPSDAEPLLRQALEAGPDSVALSQPTTASLLCGLAYLHAISGHPQQALDEALRAEDASRQHVRLTARGLSEQEVLSFTATRAAGLPLALDVLAQAASPSPAEVRRVWDALVRSRALALDEMAGRHLQAAARDDPQVRPLVTAYDDATARLASLLVRTRGSGDALFWREVERAQQERAAAERALLPASAALRARAAQEQVGLEAVVQALPEGAALVAYVRWKPATAAVIVARGGSEGPAGPERYAAFVAPPRGAEPRFVPLEPAAAPIDSLVEAWRAAAGAPPRDDRAQEAMAQVGAALALRIWTPVASFIAGCSTVFVVPDAELHLVNPAALPDGSGGYLVEAGPLLQVVSAERDLVRSPQRFANAGGMLAMGDPNFDASPAPGRDIAPAAAATLIAAAAGTRGPEPPCADLASVRWPRLPQTAREVDETVRSWRKARAQPATKLTGARATESAFRRLAPNARMLHVATHGFFLGATCGPLGDGTAGQRGIGGLVGEPALRPAVSGAPGAGGTRQPNPLQLAGLVLAGANRHDPDAPSGDDGILTVEEAATLDLRGVECAVFSACDTGVGATRAGEGVFGFRRAFQVAGAHALVFSLWPIDDAATRRWMRAFYAARLSRGETTAQAVRAAQLRVLQDRRHAGHSTHPFYWAALLASGDGR